MSAIHDGHASQAAQSVFARGSLGDRVIIALAIICTFIAFSPFGYAILTSLKSEWKDGSIIPWIQYEPTLESWDQEFGSGGRETMKALRNSTLISLGATLVATTLGTLAGYGLARFKYGIGNRNLVSWFLSQRFLPPVATLIPFVLMFRDLKLLDTLAGHGYCQRDIHLALRCLDHARLLR